MENRMNTLEKLEQEYAFERDVNGIKNDVNLNDREKLRAHRIKKLQRARRIKLSMITGVVLIISCILFLLSSILGKNENEETIENVRLECLESLDLQACTIL